MSHPSRAVHLNPPHTRLPSIALRRSAVFKHGAAGEVPLWLAAMRDELGLSSVWDALIQAMCCPVPQVRRMWYLLTRSAGVVVIG